MKMMAKNTWLLLCINVVACFSGCYHVDGENTVSTDTERGTQSTSDIADKDGSLDTSLETDNRTNIEGHDGTALSTDAEPQGGIKRKRPQQVGGSGILPEQEVVKVCNEHLQYMKECYQSILRKSPTVEGKITLRFEIDPTGYVKDVETTLSELPGEMETCLHEVFQQMVFPPPVGGNAVFEQPFLFHLKE